MLDDLSKRILKYMKTDSDNHSQKNYDFDADLEKMAQAVSAEKEAVRAAVRYLEENGYIKYLRTNSGYNIAFYLDHKGLHYDELRDLEQKEFLKKSVIVPILVTLVTNGIIALSKWLLPLIRELLSRTP